MEFVDNSVKILVVGNRGVGKRTLVKAMTQHPIWDSEPVLRSSSNSPGFMAEPLEAVVETTVKGVRSLVRMARKSAESALSSRRKLLSSSLNYNVGPPYPARRLSVGGLLTYGEDLLSKCIKVRPPGPLLFRSSLSLLPVELRFIVATFSDAVTLASLDCCSRSWKRLTRHPRLWQTTLERLNEPQIAQDYTTRCRRARRLDRLAGLYPAQRRSPLRFDSKETLAVEEVHFSFFCVDTDDPNYEAALASIPPVEAVVMVIKSCSSKKQEERDEEESLLQMKARQATACLVSGNSSAQGALRRLYHNQPPLFCFVVDDTKPAVVVDNDDIGEFIVDVVGRRVRDNRRNKKNPSLTASRQTFVTRSLRDDVHVDAIRRVLSHARYMAQCHRAHNTFLDAYNL